MDGAVNTDLDGEPNGSTCRQIAEIPGDYSTRGMEGGKGVYQTVAHGFILEPTMNRQTQLNSTNEGLMNIYEPTIMEIINAR